MFMEVAHIVAKRGTCPRASVGAVIVRDGRVSSMGCNGSPPGSDHCIDVGCHNDGGTQIRADGVELGCQRATHAELNAIVFAARQGIPTNASGMYCTHACCAQCARLIVTAGIRSFTYEVPYRLSEGLRFLTDHGVDVYRMQDVATR